MHMPRRLVVPLLCLALVHADLAVARKSPVRVEISATEWARPRSAATIVQLTSLNTLIGHFNKRPESRIVIRYAGGDESSLWAEELRAWLTSLGVPTDRTELQAGHVAADVLELELEVAETQRE